MAVWMQAELRLATGDALQEWRAWLAEQGREALGRLGGAIWGCWHGAPGFGLRSDAVLLTTVWPDDAAAGAATELLAAPRTILAVDGTPLHATARPRCGTPVSGDGLWVFRDFEIGRADAARFVELSASAWETFEANFDARIDGLFRAPDPGPELARMVLVTRYADLATWEASRSAEADPASWERFLERRALTRWTRACCAPRLEF
ncbi:MAG: NIPSNAP family protein [Pseudomonadales bacterium]|jgi:hypothetical protein|nr:NIPSNAP family protein [Pseudomonadales bacterium]